MATDALSAQPPDAPASTQKPAQKAPEGPARAVSADPRQPSTLEVLAAMFNRDYYETHVADKNLPR